MVVEIPSALCSLVAKLGGIMGIGRIWAKLTGRQPDLAGLLAEIRDYLATRPEIQQVESVEGEPFAFRLQLEDADRGTSIFHADNLIRLVQHENLNAAERQAAYRRFVGSVLQVDLPAIILERVYPCVRHQDYYQGQGVSVLQRPFVGDLSLVLLQDGEEQMWSLSPEALVEQKLDENEVWAAAEQNARRVLAGSQLVEVAPGLVAVTLPSDPMLANMLLMAPGALGYVLQSKGWQGAIIGAARREEILLADIDHFPAIEVLMQATDDGLQASHPQSTWLYEFSPGDAKIRPWRQWDGQGFAHPEA